MPSVSNRRPALAEFVKRLRTALPENVLDIRLYGSEARGDASPESDIDVFVVVQPDGQRSSLEDRIIDIAFDVNLQFDVYISPCVVPVSTKMPVPMMDPMPRAVGFQGPSDRRSNPRSASAVPSARKSARTKSRGTETSGLGRR